MSTKDHEYVSTAGALYSRAADAEVTTYAEHAAKIDPIATELERIAYRLRQGAISPQTASVKLAELAGTLAPSNCPSTVA